MAHHPRVLLTDVRFETSLARWNRLDRTLKSLAVMASAISIGCSWCVDFGYWISTQEGVDPAKLRAVPRWRDSDVFTDLERRRRGFPQAGGAGPPTGDGTKVGGPSRRPERGALRGRTCRGGGEDAPV